MPSAGTRRYASFAEFWPFYVREHSAPATRWMHFAGTASIVPLGLAAALYSPWALALYPLFGYGLAWAAHLAIEKNRPATFSHPLWSLLGDFRMFRLMLQGSMRAEVQRHATTRSPRTGT